MKNLARLALCIGYCLFLAGCGEQDADVARPRRYDTDLLSFSYPGNWKISDEGRNGFPRYAVFESPRNAAGSVLLFRPGDTMRLDEFIDSYRGFFSLKTDKSGGEGYTEEPPRLSAPVVDDGWETVTEKLKVAAGNRDVPCTRYYLRKKNGDSVCFVIEQSPDADLPKVAPGFKLISGSLSFGEAPGR